MKPDLIFSIMHNLNKITDWNTIKTFTEATLTSMLPIPSPSAYIYIQWIKVIVQIILSTNLK